MSLIKRDGKDQFEREKCAVATRSRKAVRADQPCRYAMISTRS